MKSLSTAKRLICVLRSPPILTKNDLQDFLDVFSEEAFIWGELSFVMLLDDEGSALIAVRRKRAMEWIRVTKMLCRTLFRRQLED